jgi:hypothetical protein
MAKRKGGRHGGAGQRIRFDPAKHKRDASGRFTDMAQRQQSKPQATVTEFDTIKNVEGNQLLDGMTVGEFLETHPDGAQAALYELTAAHKFRLIDFRAAGSAGKSSAGQAERPSATASDLDADDTKAIQRYTSEGYLLVNRHLRGIRDGGGPAKEQIAALDRAMRGANLDEDVAVYRGVGSLAVKRFAAQGLRKDSVLTDEGFMSTTRQRSVADAFAKQSPTNITMEIRTKRGAKARDVDAISDAQGEQEILFARNQRMKVVSFDSKKGHLVVEVLND